MENPKAEGSFLLLQLYLRAAVGGKLAIKSRKLHVFSILAWHRKKLPDSKAESKLRERYGRERVSWDREPGGIGREGLPLQLGVPGQGN